MHEFQTRTKFKDSLDQRKVYRVVLNVENITPCRRLFRHPDVLFDAASFAQLRVDDSKKIPSRFQDALNIRILGRRPRTKRQQFSEADNRIQGRAQLLVKLSPKAALVR